jgi:hypothetical protein
VIPITACPASGLLFWSGIVALQSGFPIHGALPDGCKMVTPPWGNHLIGRVLAFFNNWKIAPSPAQDRLQDRPAAIHVEASWNRCTIFPPVAG